MKSIIIDASMAAAWTLDDEKSEAGEQILHEAGKFLRRTTSLFWHEYRNILIVNQKRSRITKSDIPGALKKIRSLGIRECNLDDDEAVLSLAFQHDLSAYDAAYLALSLQENAILATNDRKLARAAMTAGVELRTVLELGSMH